MEGLLRVFCLRKKERNPGREAIGREEEVHSVWGQQIQNGSRGDYLGEGGRTHLSRGKKCA